MRGNGASCSRRPPCPSGSSNSKSAACGYATHASACASRAAVSAPRSRSPVATAWSMSWCASDRQSSGKLPDGQHRALGEMRTGAARARLLATARCLGQVAGKERLRMKRATVVAAAVLFAHTASAQCVGDANSDGHVTVNEAVQVVNNLLNGCTAQPTACPINFGDNNTMEGTPDCFYTGRWNQSCGGADLQARWISDGDIVVVQFLGFDPPIFYGAGVTSPNAA